MKFLNQSVEVTLEVLETIGLMLCFIFASPLGFFRRLDRTFSTFSYARYLMPRGLFAPLMRARLDFKMGNLLQAANIQNQVVGLLEQEVEKEDLKAVLVEKILTSVYSELMENYILSGRIEDAALIVIRAHQKIGLSALPSNPGFDVKTAHVVKAGIAAGKLLEDGGLATMMVKPGEAPVVSGTPSKSKKNKPLHKIKSSTETEKGKLIPFPSTT